MTEDAYLIDIPLHGASADQLQIDAEGNWLRITRDSSRQETREDSFDDGRGFARRYSFSSGRTSRRVGLPMDADLDAMTREETESGLRLRIPRRR
jgi:HSP20 family molecular chaperone IbpA